jgi:hypothetical protein
MKARNLHQDAQALLMATDEAETEITPLVAEMYVRLIETDMELKNFKGDISFLLEKEIAPLARVKINPFLHKVIEYCKVMEELKYEGEKVGNYVLNLK